MSGRPIPAMRSLLFVPGDRPERFEKAASSGADAIILDLEDSVSTESKAAARDAVAAYLARPAEVVRIVRINPINSRYLDADLQCTAGSDALMLPKAESASTVETLLAQIGPELAVLPIATETPLAVFGLGSYRAVAARLCGLTWGAEDLPAAIGAVSSRDEDQRYAAPYEVVRSLALFGAHAAGVEAIETVYPAIRDEAGLARYAARGAHDGFTGMMALHPLQVPVINAAFTPSEVAVDQAHKVIDAFARAPGAGVLVLDDKMIDAPHVAQARRILARSRAVR